MATSFKVRIKNNHASKDLHFYAKIGGGNNGTNGSNYIYLGEVSSGGGTNASIEHAASANGSGNQILSSDLGSSSYALQIIVTDLDTSSITLSSSTYDSAFTVDGSSSYLSPSLYQAGAGSTPQMKENSGNEMRFAEITFPSNGLSSNWGYSYSAVAWSQYKSDGSKTFGSGTECDTSIAQPTITLASQSGGSGQIKLVFAEKAYGTDEYSVDETSDLRDLAAGDFANWSYAYLCGGSGYSACSGGLGGSNPPITVTGVAYSTTSVTDDTVTISFTYTGTANGEEKITFNPPSKGIYDANLNKMSGSGWDADSYPAKSGSTGYIQFNADSSSGGTKVGTKINANQIQRLAVEKSGLNASTAAATKGDLFLDINSLTASAPAEVYDVDVDADYLILYDASIGWNRKILVEDLVNDGLKEAMQGRRAGDTVTFGADGAGGDVRFNSATSGDYMLWDASEEKLIIVGTDGQTALDVQDGDVVIADNLQVGGLGAYGLTGSSGKLDIASMGTNWTNAGITVADLGTVTTVDINGGTVDGAIIGGSSAAAGTFTGVTLNQADAAGDVALSFAQGGTVAYTMGIDDSSSGNVWKLHSATSLAESSDVALSAAGVLTVASLVATTADINGGTVDGITSLTAAGDLDIGSHDFQAEKLTADKSSGTGLAVTADATIGGDLTLTGTGSVGGDLVVTGDLTINGTTTTVNSTEVAIKDLVYVIATGSSDSAIATAGGAGLAIGGDEGGAKKASFLYDGADSWDLSDHLNLAASQEFKINNASVLSATTLGSSVVGSSLTSVGTISTGVWNGTAIATAYIADNAVTNAKLADISRGSIKVGGASDAPTDLDAKGDGKILIGDGTDVASVAISGDVALTSAGLVTIQSDAVESGMLNDNVISGQTELVHADIADEDELMISDGGTLKKVGVDSIRDHFFGVVSGDATVADGGALTIAADAVESGMLNDNVISGQTELASDGLEAADEMMISDAGVLKKIGVDNLFKDGPGLLAAGAVDIASDHFMFLDGGASGDAKIEAVADLFGALAGSGLQQDSTSKKLRVEYVQDIFQSASADALDFTSGSYLGLPTASLSQIPASDGSSGAQSGSAAVHVYLNGMLLTPSASLGGQYTKDSANSTLHDYTYLPAQNAVAFEEEIMDGDVLIIKYIKD